MMPLGKLMIAVGALILLAGLLFGCAAPQQAAIPPSPTGCYAAMPRLTIYNIPVEPPRYEPAPCNVINANQPYVVIGQ